jgi:hypothetical protein
MKTGRTLQELATEIERQANAKHDYVADSRSIAMRVEEKKPRLRIVGIDDDFGLSEVAHDQIGTKLGIPGKYYDRMLANQPELLAKNVNTWLNEEPARHMVRTLDHNARAFLSERYRPLDNFDLANIVLPRLLDTGCQIQSCELTERRLYIKAVTPRIQAEVAKGDVVQAGLAISNSEVGLGAIQIDPLIYRLVCLNGAIAQDYGMRRHHVGKSNGAMDLEAAAEFFRDSTRKQDDKAFWMKVNDVVGASLSEITFGKIVKRWQEATEQKITGKLEKVVEVTAKKFSLNDTEQSGILRHLIEGRDLSAYGLLNSITRMSQDVESYDRATELERLGPKVLELPQSQWKEIAEAA